MHSTARVTPAFFFLLIRDGDSSRFFARTHATPIYLVGSPASTAQPLRARRPRLLLAGVCEFTPLKCFFFPPCLVWCLLSTAAFCARVCVFVFAIPFRSCEQHGATSCPEVDVKVPPAATFPAGRERDLDSYAVGEKTLPPTMYHGTFQANTCVFRATIYIYQCTGDRPLVPPMLRLRRSNYSSTHLM